MIDWTYVAYGMAAATLGYPIVYYTLLSIDRALKWMAD